MEGGFSSSGKKFSLAGAQAWGHGGLGLRGMAGEASAHR